jgi:hypothetical protein
MVEAKLLVGRCLQFTPGANRHLPAGAHVPAFVPVICPTMTIQDSVRRNPGGKHNPFKNVGGVRESVAIQGANTVKVHRNFKWLPWYAGDISETALDHDVLTGPMSGCTLLSYRRNGAHVVGHIGTMDDPDGSRAAFNNSVNALWNAYATAHPADVIGGFNPVGGGVPAHPPAQPGDQGGKTWGLFTTNGLFYSIQVQIVATNTAALGPITPTFRVVRVHQVPSMTLHALQHL